MMPALFNCTELDISWFHNKKVSTSKINLNESKNQEKFFHSIKVACKCLKSSQLSSDGTNIIQRTYSTSF